MSRTTISRLSRGTVAAVRRLLPATEGGTSIEYALLAAMIALVIVGALGNLGAALVGLPLPALIAAIGGAS